jgi:hypothetical protein
MDERTVTRRLSAAFLDRLVPVLGSRGCEVVAAGAPDRGRGGATG